MCDLEHAVLGYFYHQKHDYNLWLFKGTQVIELEYHGVLEIRPGRYSFEGEEVNIHDLYKSLASRRVLGPDGVQCRYFFEERTSVLSEEECKKLKYIHTHSHYKETDILRTLSLCSEMQIFMLFSMLPLRRMTLVMPVLQSLRFLRLGICVNLEEIQGWNWAPNLVSIELYGCGRLEELGDIGCLHNLEKLIIEAGRVTGSGILRQQPRCTVPDLTGCHKLKTLRFVSRCLKTLTSLGQPLNLQELDLSFNENLVDMGTIGTFTALQRLSLQHCSSLRKFPNANLSRLISLDLSACSHLESIEGRVCVFTALEKLDLSYCHQVDRIPDLKHLARLEILDAHDCSSLKELKLGAANLSSLEVLNLRGCQSSVHQYNAGAGCSYNLRSLIAGKLGVPGDLTPFPGQQVQQLGAENVLEDSSRKGQHEVGGMPCMDQCQLGTQLYYWNAFVKLRELKVYGWSLCGSMVVLVLDVSGLPSLENLHLQSFQSLQVIQVALPSKLNTLELRYFPSLQVIKGALPELKHLEIVGCLSLKQICNFGNANYRSTQLNHIKEAEDSSGSLQNLQEQVILSKQTFLLYVLGTYFLHFQIN